ncbi:Ubiquitin carboxyl-terminal hydrolase MINDY-2 [Saguinus oedipus]|uniref:Ubiquitin carboxyl-terminal hydrolase n=1 Tax=Saguinus oedipus TaxID=9490 RepID=A0ABQ9UHL8_SAGOE|nr:Ubiquitin carboxyl-terminal hydrolase MINDY-2 [Saguinus oedipus]
MAVLHKFQTGLDVNVRFTGVRVFEYTLECIVFDLLDIPLYYGCLVDPQIDDIVKAVGNCSYNQLVEKIIFCKQSDNSELLSEGFVAEQFLNNTATQPTYHGLCELTSTVQEENFVCSFGIIILAPSPNTPSPNTKYPETVYKGQQDQIDQSYLMALSLQQEQQSQEINWENFPEGISDLELAEKLQEKENRRASQYFQEQEQAAASAASIQAQQGQPKQASP